MQKLPLFQADIFYMSNVGDATQISNLLNQIQEEKRVAPPTPNSNEGCWRSSKQWSDIDWLIEQVYKLAVQAQDHYMPLDSIFNRPKEKFRIEMWTNVNPTGTRNVFHSHKVANFSAVYYLQGTGTGKLRLANPANTLIDCNPVGPFTRDFEFDPRDGDLILWPAWVPHEVYTNPSSKDRINLAFDIYTNQI
jgi:uncharacterized protein (TIGR02466 family)